MHAGATPASSGLPHHQFVFLLEWRFLTISLVRSILTATQANLAKRKVIFKRAEQYTKEYRAAEREEIRLRRAAKAKGDFYVAGQPKVVFVVRLRGINNIAPKPRKILQLLRLLQINNGVFVRLTKATSQMLQLVQPYVTYGPANLKTIRDLVYKRGYAKVNRQRLPINDNKIIEENLGKYGILSIEDIVHEIATCGPNFKAVTNFLWAFKLSNPNGGFKGKKLTTTPRAATPATVARLSTPSFDE